MCLVNIDLFMFIKHIFQKWTNFLMAYPRFQKDSSSFCFHFKNHLQLRVIIIRNDLLFIRGKLAKKIVSMDKKNLGLKTNENIKWPVCNPNSNRLKLQVVSILVT